MSARDAITATRKALQSAMAAGPSTIEAEFYRQLVATRMHLAADGLEREWKFHPTRLWRFDFAWPKAKIAVEVEGVVGGAGGRHQRIQGYQLDCEKYNAATILGWRVLRGTGRMVTRGELLADLEKILGRYQR